ncbi:Minor tail protein precursor H [Escherichia coli]|nr:Minor tail protein precursor H [Escherichia coli]
MEGGKSVCGPERGCHETAVILAGKKSLLAHEKETLEYKRQLADLGDKVEHPETPE